MKNSILTLFISLMLVISLFGADYVSANSNDEVIVYADLLKKLDVVDMSNVVSGKISRMDFLKAVLKMMKNDAVIYESVDEMPFNDVDRDSSDAGYPAMACKLGFISKSDKFRPNDSITFNEAVKILSGFLGYTELAEFKGGYPIGYFTVAKQAGILENVNDDYGDALSAVQFERLLVNTLEAEPLRIKSISDSGGTVVNNNSGKTVMNIYFDMYKTSGIVSSDEMTSLLSDENIGRGRIEIDGVQYNSCDSGAGKMLGFKSDVYYKKSNTNAVGDIVYIFAPEDYNNIYTVDYTSFDADSDKDGFNYFKDLKSENIRIDANASYVYNGKLSSRGSVKLYPDVGNVLLIDNDLDNSVDVVKIYDYKTLCVKQVLSYGKKIYGRNGDIIVPDEDDDSLTTIIKNNSEIGYSDIKTDDILSYYETDVDGKSFCHIIVSDKKINNTVTATDDEFVWIGGGKYRYDDSVKELLKPGKIQTLGIDAFGRVFTVYSNDEYVYGYLRGVAKKSLDDIIVRIFTENGNWVTLDVNNYVKSNGARYSKEQFYDKFCSNDAQMIRYKVNEDGNLIVADTAIDIQRWSDEEKAAIDADKFRCSLTAQNLCYRGGTKSLENEIFPSSKTKIFCIPSDNASEDKYEIIGALSEIVGNDASLKSVSAYDMDMLGCPAAMTVEFNGVSRKYSDVFIFTNMLEVLNDDNDSAYALAGGYRGYNVELAVKDVSVLKGKNPQKGDVFSLSFSKNGEIINLNPLLKYGENTEPLLIGEKYDKNGYAFGTVSEIDMKNARIAVDLGSNGINIYDVSPAKVYICRSDTDKIENGSYEDIAVGNKVFMRINYLRCIEVVIYD